MVREAPTARAFQGLDAIADTVELGIAAVDGSLTVQSTNRAFRAILDLDADLPAATRGTAVSLDQLIALLEPRIDKLDWPAVRHRIADAPPHGDAVYFDFRLRNALVVRSRVHALDDGGRVLTVFDITDLVGASHNALAIERRYAMALDASDQSIWDWDLGTDQVTVGERFWDQIGRPDIGPSVAFDQFLALIAPPQRDELARELADRVKELGAAAAPVTRSVRIETPHGEERHFILTHLLAIDGPQAMVTGLIRDVTESRRLRQAIVEARQRAETEAQTRSNFLAVMSHEIRTPLNGVLGNARLLLDAGLKPAQRDLAAIIKDSGEALLGIINQVLDYSRLEAGGMELERTTFDLAQLIEGAAKLMTPDAEAKGLRLDTRVASDVAFGIAGDPGRIRQIVLNLLANAIKFTEQGHVLVSAFLVEKIDGVAWVRIEVEDTGIGIAEEAQSRVFAEFTQADASVSRLHGGTGLGLAICRGLATQMGGEIGLTSQVGSGSTFWLMLPLDLAGGEAAKEPVAAESKSAGAPVATGRPARRILVVDDNELNRRIMAALLDGLGENYDMAEGGEEAIAAVQGADYDTVLMDMQMPGLDGVQTVRAIRRLSGHGVHPRIIAVTANTAEEASRALATVDGFVSKPVDAAEVASAIQTVRTKRMADEPGPTAGEPAVNAVFAKLTTVLGHAQTVNLYREFAQDARKRIGRMEGAARDGALEALGRDAHDLKSTAGNFGFAELAELGSVIETACRNGEAARAIELVAHIRAPTERALATIELLDMAPGPAVES